MENFRSPYLEMLTESREVLYMGYTLPLTSGEYEVLRVVLESDGCIDKEEIRERTPSDVKMSQGSIPVHVNAINRKALAIGGRKIIGFKRKCGYFVEEKI